MDELLDPLSITKYWHNQTPPKFSEIKQDEKFTDKYFPPNYSSLVSRNIRGEYTDIINGENNKLLLLEKYPNLKKITWKRIEEIESEIEIFAEKISLEDFS